MNIGIKLSISLPIVFVIHYLLISGLDRMHSIDVLTIYWAAKYYIRLRCAHNVFVRNIGPVTLCYIKCVLYPDSALVEARTPIELSMMGATTTD